MIVIWFGTIMIAMMLLGGIKRIGQVTEKLVPFMAVLYVILALGVIIMNIEPDALLDGTAAPACT